MRNLATILPLKSKVSGNFSVLMLYMKVSKCLNIDEFPKISIKMKNCKTFYETQTVSRLKENFYFCISYGDIQKYTDICFQSA